MLAQGPALPAALAVALLLATPGAGSRRPAPRGPTPSVDPCRLLSVAECSAAKPLQCGWCCDTLKCTAGNVEGPSHGECNNWLPRVLQCPLPAPNVTPEPPAATLPPLYFHCLALATSLFLAALAWWHVSATLRDREAPAPSPTVPVPRRKPLYSAETAHLGTSLPRPIGGRGGL
eukprot:EG_transcript_31790